MIPALLLRQAVGVDAGESLHQRGLAVVDVAGGSDDHVRTSASAQEFPFALRVGIEGGRIPDSSECRIRSSFDTSDERFWEVNIMVHFKCSGTDSSFAVQSPAINASFFARLQPLIRLHSASENACDQTRLTGRRVGPGAFDADPLARSSVWYRGMNNAAGGRMVGTMSPYIFAARVFCHVGAAEVVVELVLDDDALLATWCRKRACPGSGRG